jgi:23S rRNA (guanosine2251-2'-O)-methyltransferase
MLKDYNKDKFLSFNDSKRFKILLDLAYFIEDKALDFDNKHFQKLIKYHSYLSETDSHLSNILIKEFEKINKRKQQWNIYITLLERLVGKSKQEYEFLIDEGDKESARETNPIAVLIDGVRSMHNLGAILRNCECFGVEKVYIKSLGVDIDYKKLAKTSMGTHKNLEIEEVNDSLELVQIYSQKGYDVLALDTGKSSTNINDYNVSACNGFLLILGHEQFGIDYKLIQASHKVLLIPMFGIKNSLNVAVASGIALHKLTENCRYMTR